MQPGLSPVVALTFRVATVFWWLWMLGVAVFAAMAVQGLFAAPPAPPAKPPTSAEKFGMVGAALAMLGFGFLFRALLRRSERRVRELLAPQAERRPAG